MYMYQIFKKFNGMDSLVASYKTEEKAKANLENYNEEVFLKEIPITTREEYLEYLTEKGYLIFGNKVTQLDSSGDYLATFLILHYERGNDEDGNYDNDYCLKMLKHADIDGTIIQDGLVDENGNFCTLDGKIHDVNLDKVV